MGKNTKNTNMISFKLEDIMKCDLKQLEEKIAFLALYCLQNDYQWKSHLVEIALESVRTQNCDKINNCILAFSEFSDPEMMNLANCLRRARIIIRDVTELKPKKPRKSKSEGAKNDKKKDDIG